MSEKRKGPFDERKNVNVNKISKHENMFEGRNETLNKITIKYI